MLCTNRIFLSALAQNIPINCEGGKSLAIIIILLALTAFIFLPISMQIRTVEGRERFFRVRIRVLGVTCYTLTFALRLRDGIFPELLRVYKTGYKKVFTIRNIKFGSERHRSKRYLLHVGAVKKLNIQLLIGTEDAAMTAFLCGLADIAADVLAKWKHRKIDSMKFVAQPVFNRPALCLRLNCIITTKIAHIIREYFKEVKQHASNRKHSQNYNV